MSRDTPERGPLDRIKELALRNDPLFFAALRDATRDAREAAEILLLSALRRKAAQKGLATPQTAIRIALLGGYTLHPLNELIAHFLAAAFPTSSNAEFLLGEFDNYNAEILDASSRLYAFQPQVIMLLPSHRRCQPPGHLSDDRDRHEAAARDAASQILGLCRIAASRSGAEVVLTTFPLPGRHDPGSYRARTAGSDWSFRKLVNLELGLNAPASVYICDVEFLSARRGTLDAWDARAWFESKQPYGQGLLLDVAREAAHIISRLHAPPKKVAAVDLDNTLWGGVIGDDGLEGIELGDTTPRGEAFKAFQQYLRSLANRGVLLAVCSKNDRARAIDAFEKHPEMVLRMEDFAAFQANWDPKPDNLRRIARTLNLGLDSIVFLDDDPAELDIVRRFAPEVDCIGLGPDPADYVSICQDSRCFELSMVTTEDRARTSRYREEARRQESMTGTPDMDAWLESLEMRATISEFRPVDVPRIAQLINKTNPFNLTARRRTAAEVEALMADPAYFGFSIRLADRFGDYGLISVVIARVNGDEAEIDTWLMSCRVLKRQVEDEALNRLVCLARQRGCRRIRGTYVPTSRNEMVRSYYPDSGFLTSGDNEYLLDVTSYQPKPTRIESFYDPR